MSEWINFVKKVQKEHNLSYKDALVKASQLRRGKKEDKPEDNQEGEGVVDDVLDRIVKTLGPVALKAAKNVASNVMEKARQDRPKRRRV